MLCGVLTDYNVESRSVVAVSGESETTMDCTESEMLNDVVDIISNDVFNKQVCIMIIIIQWVAGTSPSVH